MKLRTLSSKFPLLRKDIFRFAPLWGGYLVVCIPILLWQIFSGLKYTLDSALYAKLLLSSIKRAGVIHMIYAGLVAVLLFGDLFSKTRCEALHAMPVRRNKWFFSHVLHGLLYSVVPNTLVAVCMLPLLGSYWYAGVIWVLGMFLQYLTFFGIAVLCVFLSGNHIGMVMFYGILNYGYIMVFWLIQKVYQPFLPGIQLEMLDPDLTTPMFYLSPVIQFKNLSASIFAWEGTEIRQMVRSEQGIIYFTRAIQEQTGFTSYFYIYLMYAGAGVVLIALSLLLYRVRKLECTEELTAFRFLPVVLSVVFPFLVGYGVYELSYYIQGPVLRKGNNSGLNLTLFFAALVLGWFGVQMLLHKTVKIFRRKTLRKFGFFAGVIGLILGVTLLLPVNMQNKIPETQQIKFATLKHQVGYGTPIEAYKYDKEAIEAIRQLHAQMIKDHSLAPEAFDTMTIEYELINGEKIQNVFIVEEHSDAWNAIKKAFCSVDQLFCSKGKDHWMQETKSIRWDGSDLQELLDNYQEKTGQAYPVPFDQVKEELLQAIFADWEDGQIVHQAYAMSIRNRIRVGMTDNKGRNTAALYLTTAANNCLAWREKYADLFS